MLHFNQICKQTAEANLKLKRKMRLFSMNFKHYEQKKSCKCILNKWENEHEEKMSLMHSEILLGESPFSLELPIKILWQPKNNKKSLFGVQLTLHKKVTSCCDISFLFPIRECCSSLPQCFYYDAIYFQILSSITNRLIRLIK